MKLNKKDLLHNNRQNYNLIYIYKSTIKIMVLLQFFAAITIVIGFINGFELVHLISFLFFYILSLFLLYPYIRNLKSHFIFNKKLRRIIG